MTIIALIPARSGSQRIPNKNIKHLAGHPLMAYSIASARESGLFDRIIVSTDSEAYAEVAVRYGAEVPFMRPPAMARDDSPDYDWLFYTMRMLWEDYVRPDIFAILRVTSPFRSAHTIQRAYEQFKDDMQADSLRAVEPAKQHPGKMWVIRDERLFPLMPWDMHKTPWHSNPTQNLPKVYVQNASLEMARTMRMFETRTISGHVIRPFFTRDWEGFDLNTHYDWSIAEKAVQLGKAVLPEVKGVRQN